MTLLNYYPHLEGSHGKMRLTMDQALLDKFCALLKNQFKDRMHDLRITPVGENRFRIQAELSNWFYQFFGAVGLRVLRGEGIVIQILYPTASRKEPTIEGSMDTTLFGKDLAIPSLVAAINEGLGVREAFEVTETKWLGWTQFRVYVAVHPFRLLRKFLPAEIGRHITRVKWQATENAFYFDFTWEHSGIKRKPTAPNEGKTDG